jgi:hypothetical protein
MKIDHQKRIQGNMRKSKYDELWLILVKFEAQENYRFNDLINAEDEDPKYEFKGAYANVIVKSRDIINAIEIVPKGLLELNFQVLQVQRVEQFRHLIEDRKVTQSVIEEADWLIKSKYVFMISDRIFPYK